MRYLPDRGSGKALLCGVAVVGLPDPLSRRTERRGSAGGGEQERLFNPVGDFFGLPADRDRQRHVLSHGTLDERTAVLWFAEHLEAADRKSTRLNSSHVKISYAVFCLKKK